jgi:hypothetical protein
MPGGEPNPGNETGKDFRPVITREFKPANLSGNDVLTIVDQYRYADYKVRELQANADRKPVDALDMQFHKGVAFAFGQVLKTIGIQAEELIVRKPDEPEELENKKKS